MKTPDRSEHNASAITRRLLACVAALTLFPFLAFSQDAAPDTERDTPPAAGVIPLVTLHAAGDSYTMGDGTFGPGVTETITADFSLSKYPITNSQFGNFVAAGGYAEQGYWTRNGWAWKGKKIQPAYWTDA